MRDELALPLWSRFLFWPFKGEPRYPQIIGDMSEELAQRLADDGPESARRWLRREVWRTLWALVWRWETAAVVAASLLAVAAIQLTVLGLTLALGLNHRLQLATVLPIWLGTPVLLGLVGGALAGWMQSRHERLGRLTLVTIVSAPPFVAALVYWAQHKAYWTMMLSSAVSLRRLVFLASLWLGSVWMERRNRRRVAARAAG